MKEALTSKIGVALLLIVFTGCDAAPERTENGVALTAGGGYGEVQEFTLKDGTPCAAIIGYQKAALTCDWSRKP